MQYKWNDLFIEESNDWIVLNKPSGLLSIPDREGKEISLKQILQEKYGSIFTVHRLDKDTSGVIIFAKNEKAHKFLSQQFEQRQTKKIYTGLVMGTPYQASGTVNAPIAEHPIQKGTMVIHRSGKEAITDYELLEDFGMYSYMQFQIHTGRTHQIRVHAKEIGSALVGDSLYGDGKPLMLSSIKGKKFKLGKYVEEETPILNQLALHAKELTINLPDGSVQTFEAEIPKNLKASLQQLRKWRGKKEQ